MSKDEEMEELRDEIEELKSSIKNLSKSQTEAYKHFDASALGEEEKERKLNDKIQRDLDRANRRKEREEHKHQREPKPRPIVKPRPIKPPKPPKPAKPLFSEDDFKFNFDFDWDSDEFKDKMKTIMKKVEKASEDGIKTAKKVSEKISKDLHKFLEKETEKITRAVELADEDYAEMNHDIGEARTSIAEAQREVDEARRGVDEARRGVSSIQRRLEHAYRDNDIEKQVETERELNEAEKELMDSMSHLSKTRSEVAQTRREFARLQRRAGKIRAAQRKGHGPRVVIASKDYDSDGTITEYVAKVVNSIGKNLESSLRSAVGEGKKGVRRVLSIGDKADDTILIHPNGRVDIDALEKFYENAAELLSALGDKNRLKLLKILEDSPQYQKELSEDTGLRGGTFKHHTDILQDEGFITREAIRGRYLITQLGIEALKLAEMIYLREKQLEEEINIDIED
ncbi:MAG: ArsR family transcriptional regulator [Candidatus Heimdallarchaeaceae archaeon]